MATITKRGDRQWQAKIRRKGQPAVSKTYETKKEAEDWAAAIEGRMVTSDFVDNRQAAKTTLRQVLQTYLDTVVPTKKGHQLEYMVEDWKERPLAERFIGSIRTADVMEWMTERSGTVITVYERDKTGAVATDGSGKPLVRSSRTIAPKTVRNELAVLSAVFTYAKSALGMSGLVNPVLQIPRGSRPKAKGRDRRLADGEYERLLAACRADRNKWIGPVFEFAVETAARRSEIANLTWDDVDLGACTARLRETKNGEDREIGLSKKAVSLLEGLASKPGEGEAAPGKAVFPVTPDAITQAFQRVKKRAGIADRDGPGGLTFHDNRHEATSRLFEKGLNVMEAATQTGHKTLQMLHRYTNLKAKDIAAKLG